MARLAPDSVSAMATSQRRLLPSLNLDPVDRVPRLMITHIDKERFRL